MKLKKKTVYSALEKNDQARPATTIRYSLWASLFGSSFTIFANSFGTQLAKLQWTCMFTKTHRAGCIRIYTQLRTECRPSCSRTAWHNFFLRLQRMSLVRKLDSGGRLFITGFNIMPMGHHPPSRSGRAGCNFRGQLGSGTASSAALARMRREKIMPHVCPVVSERLLLCQRCRRPLAARIA